MWRRKSHNASDIQKHLKKEKMENIGRRKKSLSIFGKNIKNKLKRCFHISYKSSRNYILPADIVQISSELLIDEIKYRRMQILKK